MGISVSYMHLPFYIINKKKKIILISILKIWKEGVCDRLIVNVIFFSQELEYSTCELTWLVLWKSTANILCNYNVNIIHDSIGNYEKTIFILERKACAIVFKECWSFENFEEGNYCCLNLAFWTCQTSSFKTNEAVLIGQQSSFVH